MKENLSSPSIFVILGVTGDLAAKKIIPSLWYLFQRELLPKKLSVIGFARRPLTDTEFRLLINEAVVRHCGDIKISEEDFSRFYEIFSYHSGTFEDQAAFASLATRIAQIESAWEVCANKLFYLATPPSSYKSIFKNLESAKLNIPCGGELGWSRLLIEKPFGTNMASAKELQALLSLYFKEEQIYRIDHYLFKETIQGIENFRFSNNLFENTWDNTTIERIDVRLLEKIGVEKRGSLYDAIGTLRDVGQNHLLSMLSAVAMEYPVGMGAAEVQKNRAKILEKLSPWTEETLRNNTRRGQYSSFNQIAGVDKDSQTETYFAIQTELKDARWKGIPIFLEAGKRMSEDCKEIILTLKHPLKCLLCEVGPHAPNRIIFRLGTNDEILIHFWTKRPGLEQVIEERVFSFFLYENKAKIQFVEEYAKIIHAAMDGNQRRFISFEEVAASWKFIDPIVDGWKRGVTPLEVYEPETSLLAKKFDAEIETSAKNEVLDKVEMGIIGLGKMGANLARQLHDKKWKIIGYNRTPDATKQLEKDGILGAYSLPELISKLSKPRTLWLMVPHQVVDDVLTELTPLLEAGDVVIDGGNSPYKESMRRSVELREKNIKFLDVGVSGGPSGARYGACLMVGGKQDEYEIYEQLFKDLSVPMGYAYMGPTGAGHFVKMIHNGIEYGMMQSIGEGFAIMKKSPFMLNLHSIAKVYGHGSVITSRLVDWLADAYGKFGDDLDDEECCSGVVSHSGEGQWTVDAAKELGVPATIIEGSLEFRKQSKSSPSYTGQVVSALRHEFGGHSVKNKGDADIYR